MIRIAAITGAALLSASILFAQGTIDAIYVFVILIDIFLLLPRKTR